jgi:hypothetical protein
MCVCVCVCVCVCTSEPEFSVQQLFAVYRKETCSCRIWEWAGKRKRGSKSSGNGNMEETTAYLFPTPTEV